MEMYLDILDLLDQRPPLKLTEILQKITVSCNMMRENIDFLTKQGLIEIKILRKKRKAYVISQLGVTVLEQIRELKRPLPEMKETGIKAKNQETVFVLIPNSVANVY